MSILIKGMEMPKEGCKDCLLVKRGQVFDICPFLKREVNGNVERGGKPLGCPLVHVPEPHGDLIDRDEMCEGLVSNHPVVIYAKSAPTIIPAEEPTIGEIVERTLKAKGLMADNEEGE